MLMFFHLTASCLQITTWVKVETDISEWIDIASVNHNSITVFPFNYFTNLRIIHRSLGVASLKRLCGLRIILKMNECKKYSFDLQVKSILLQKISFFNMFNYSWLIWSISATISTIFYKLCTNQIIDAS